MRGTEGRPWPEAAWELILVVNLANLEEGTSFEELPPSDWPGGTSVGHLS